MIMDIGTNFSKRDSKRLYRDNDPYGLGKEKRLSS